MFNDLTRRQVRQATGAASLALALPAVGADRMPPGKAPDKGAEGAPEHFAGCQALGIGLVADAHQDIVHDGCAVVADRLSSPNLIWSLSCPSDL